MGAPFAERQYTRLLVTYLGPLWPRALLLLVLLFATVGLQLAAPLILRRFLDAATAGASMGALGQVAALFIGIALAQQAVAVAEAYAGEDVGWRATNALRADLMRHCLRLDPPFHQAHPSRRSTATSPRWPTSFRASWPAS
jgi:ATP-binding cassette subfamily B protein